MANNSRKKLSPESGLKERSALGESLRESWAEKTGITMCERPTNAGPGAQRREKQAQDGAGEPTVTGSKRKRN